MSQGLNYGYSRLLEASEGKETDSPRKAPEVMQPAPSWILDFFFFFNLQNDKEGNEFMLF